MNILKLLDIYSMPYKLSVTDKKSKYTNIVLLQDWAIGLMSRVFTSGPGDQGSIPGHTKDTKNGT